MLETIHDGKRCSLCGDDFCEHEAVSEVQALVWYSWGGYLETGSYVIVKYHPECKQEEEFH